MYLHFLLNNPEGSKCFQDLNQFHLHVRLVNFMAICCESHSKCVIFWLQYMVHLSSLFSDCLLLTLPHLCYFVNLSLSLIFCWQFCFGFQCKVILDIYWVRNRWEDARWCHYPHKCVRTVNIYKRMNESRNLFVAIEICVS